MTEPPRKPLPVNPHQALGTIVSRMTPGALNGTSGFIGSVAADVAARTRGQAPAATANVSSGGSVVAGVITSGTAVSIQSTANNPAGSTSADDTAIAMGVSATAFYQGIGIGNSSVAGNHAVAVGLTALANSDGAVSVGNGTSVNSLATNTVAIGNLASSTYPGSGSQTTDAVAIGSSSQANGKEVVAIGGSALATGDGSIAIGKSSAVSGLHTAGVAVGRGAVVSANYGVAIGGTTGATNALASAAGAVAIGVDSGGAAAQSSTANLIVLGTSNHSTKIPGKFGCNGATPQAKAATPVTLADVIVILQNFGLAT